MTRPWRRARNLLRALLPDQLKIRWRGWHIAYPVWDCDCSLCTDTIPGIADGHTDDGDNCPCNPIDIPVPCDDGQIAFVTVHRINPDTDPAAQADRCATLFEACEAVRRDTT